MQYVGRQGAVSCHRRVVALAIPSRRCVLCPLLGASLPLFQPVEAARQGPLGGIDGRSAGISPGRIGPFRVRFFDDRQAPADDDGVTVLLERQGDKNRRVRLRRSSGSRGVFEATFGKPLEGSYHAWVATPTLPGDPPAADFLVVAPPGEMAQIRTDTGELKRASQETKGRFYAGHCVGVAWRPARGSASAHGPLAPRCAVEPMARAVAVSDPARRRVGSEQRGGML